MTSFEFAFALFSLLLGLAIAEIFQGFARVLRMEARARVGRERKVRIGWLVPLLATLLLFNQLTFWMLANSVKDTLPVTYLTLIGVTAIVGGYYLFATLVFPDEPEEWPDFDDYYDQHNRFILVGVLLMTIATAVVSNVYAPTLTPDQIAARETTAADIAAFATLFALMANVAVIFVRNRLANALLLAGLISFNVVAAILLLIAGFKPT
jgi:hypothetical protein